MKKKLVILIAVVVLCLGVFTGCDQRQADDVSYNLSLEADNFEEAIIKAKERMAYHESAKPNAYEYIGGHKIPEDYE